MATITLTLTFNNVPENAEAEIKDDVWMLCPPPSVPEGQQHISKGQNVIRYLKQCIKDVVKEARRRQAAEAAKAAINSVDTELGNGS